MYCLFPVNLNRDYGVKNVELRSIPAICLLYNPIHHYPEAIHVILGETASYIGQITQGESE